MSISTTASRLTGFVRTWAMAYALGATLLASSYTVANNIPNMIFELVAGGVLSSVFIPVFIERRQREGDEDAWHFASYVFNITVLALGLVAIVGTIWAEPFVRTQTFRIDPEKAQLATYLFRFFAVQVVFYGAMAIFTGVLNSYRRFTAPAVAPIFNNFVVIITLLGFYVPLSRAGREDLATIALAVGTSLGVLTMALVQMPSMLKLGVRYTPRIDWGHPGVRRMARMMGPTIGYVVMNIIAVSFRSAYAFETSESGPAFLLYAWMFYQLPYGIFAVALATAIFPELSTHAEREDWAGFKATFARGLRTTAALIIPMSAMLIALSTPLISLYRAGRFQAADVPDVASVLAWWGAGLFFYASYMFVLKTFYSLQDTKTPMLTNLALVGVHVGLYALLTTGIDGWDGLGLIGVPIADGVFYGVHLVVLTLILRRRIGGFDIRGIASSVWRTVVASTGGALAAVAVMRLTQQLSDFRLGFLLQLLGAGAIGLAVTYSLAALMHVPEVRAARDMGLRVLGRLLPRNRRG